MNDAEKKLLEEYFRKNVMFDVPAECFTSFKTGGILSAVVFPENRDEIEFLFDLSRKGMPVRFIGKGSNVLISDSGFDGIIAVTKRISGINCYQNYVSVLCGTKISSLINYCIKNGLSGFEFLSGIPGTIGGALMNNAGTKDRSISHLVLSVEYMDKSGNWQNKKRDHIAWQYRYSGLKDETFFVFSATLMAEKGDSSEIIKMVKEIMKRRRKTQPLEYPSAGSVFKNPHGYYAGKLIEDAGLKGLRIGGAMISEKHANFIVNTGNASSSEIWGLIKHIQETINHRYNILLEPEIEFIGRFP